MSTPPGPSTVYNKVDVKSANRNLWLVKVPKYIDKFWQDASTSSNKTLGTIKMVRSGPGKPRITYQLSEHLTEGQNDVPRDFHLQMTPLVGQHFHVLSAEDLEDQQPVDGQALKQRVVIEGKVSAKAELRPASVDAAYMKMKSAHVKRATYPRTMTKLVRDNPISYKPVSIHEEQLAHNRERKERGRNERADKDQVMDMLFAAFEKHQYYNIKTLLSITNQPTAYLKDILKEICVYNNKAPHRNMYELKPEYRHYKNDETPAK